MSHGIWNLESSTHLYDQGQIQEGDGHHEAQSVGLQTQRHQDQLRIKDEVGVCASMQTCKFYQICATELRAHQLIHLSAF